MVKHFINKPESIVDDAIEGLLRAGGSDGLARLDASAGIRVVLRDPIPRDRVALISGGGSGHEPAHAGFVGTGMLTAAVCGDIFASPPVEAVLAAIRAVTGPAGCLLIVKNYTGDRLNFGLAAERARAEGLSVEMVLVSEDVALPAAAQPRGLAGTLFVHKIAGAAAEAGEDLITVAGLAERVASASRTISLSLTSCAIPGQDTTDRIAADEVEFGLGIHGEPGAETLPIGQAHDLMDLLQNRLLDDLDGSAKIALLINTLGGVPPIEAQIVAQAVLAGPLGDRTEYVVGPAPLMTSLDMRGVSLTALPLDDTLREYLTAPASPSAWLSARPISTPKLVKIAHKPEDEAMASPSDDPETRRVIERACAALEEMAPDLDALDAKVGDGDTGTTFAAGARDIRSNLDTLPLAEPGALFGALATILSRRAGGSSGVLLSILFAAAGRHAETGESPARALRQGLERMKEIGGAGRGDRTMIDALEPALEALEDAGLAAAAKAARAGADSTMGMSTAQAGRSAYVPSDRLTGLPDPGAEGVARLFETLADRS